MIELPEKIQLLKDFVELNYEEWKKFVEVELKGIPFDKKLVTKTYEGIDLKPIYDIDDIKNLEQLKSKPGYPDFIRGTGISGYLIENWNIHQSIHNTLPEDFNNILSHNLKYGQNCIYLYPDWYSISNLNPPSHYTKEHYYNGLSIFHHSDFDNIFKNIDIYKYPVYIKTGFNGLPIFMLFYTFLKKHGLDFNKIKGGLYTDPYEHLVLYGSLPDSLKNTFDSLAILTDWISNNSDNFKTINVSGLPYHNSGATTIQELAYCFATAIEYINNLLERNLDINKIARSFTFTFGIGPFYFMEIAKLRAARMLWSKIIASYGGNEDSRKIHITSVTSTYNKSILDPYVNILRTITETFSAVLGGANSIQTAPFDESIRLPDEFSQHIARNVQIILNSEANLYRLIDPAGGSYFVEYLTNQIAQNTYKYVKEIISKGGFLHLLKNEIIQKEIEKIHELKVNDFAKRKYILVGVNKYSNTNEKRLESNNQDFEYIYQKRYKDLQKIKESQNNSERISTINKENILKEIDKEFITELTIEDIFNFIKSPSQEILKIKTIKQKRLAEIFEVLKEVTNEIKLKRGKAPVVFLATMGSLKEYKARAEFSREFFEVGGFNVIIGKGYNSGEEAIKEALKNSPEIIVICSTDELYKEFVPQITTELSRNKIKIILVLAGYPEEQVEHYKKLGIDEFIYLGVNAFETLNNIIKRII